MNRYKELGVVATVARAICREAGYVWGDSTSDEAFMDQARAAIDAYEAARTPVDVVEMVAELRNGNFDKALIEVPDALIHIAAERDAALAEEERMTVLLDGGDQELQERLLKAEAERDVLAKALRRHHRSSQLRGGSSRLYIQHIKEEWGIGHDTAVLLKMYGEEEKKS